MNRKIYILSILLILFMTVSIFMVLLIKKQGFEEKRESLLEQLYNNIEEAKLEGNYECCIEPPCTMCYLGNWIWEDGSCYCDRMIIEGKNEDVCPQCVKGIEEGKCKSTENNEGWCEI